MSRPPRARHRRIHLMYGNGGGGHKATAAAIAAVLPLLHPCPPSVELVDASSVSGASAGDWLYNLLLSYNAVSTIELMHSALSLFWPVALPALRNAFRAYWARQPDLCCVVSLVPMLNAVFAETLPPPVALFTVLTDFSHTSSHPWIQHPRQHLITGTRLAYAQALQAGHLPEGLMGTSHAVTRTPGMVVHPKFYRAASQALKEQRRVEMGFAAEKPTVLVLFGGAPPTDLVADLVAHFGKRQPWSPVNLIVVCARNRVLYQKVMRQKERNPAQSIYVTGYSSEIPVFMQMADVLIGKPGPGVVSEAYVSGLPCVMVTGASENHVMKQEKDVLDWVRKEGVGKVVRSVADAANISVAEIADMKQRISSRPENDAVFQVGKLILKAVGMAMLEEQLEEQQVGMEDTSGATAADVEERERRNAPSQYIWPEERTASLSPTTITAQIKVYPC